VSKEEGKRSVVRGPKKFKGRFNPDVFGGTAWFDVMDRVMKNGEGTRGVVKCDAKCLMNDKSVMKAWKMNGNDRKCVRVESMNEKRCFEMNGTAQCER